MKKTEIYTIGSILKFIDYEYMTDEQLYNYGGEDINDKDFQQEVISNLIIPGVKREFSQKRLEMARAGIKLAIEDIKEVEEIFDDMISPFECEIRDKKDFLKNVYKGVFGEELIIVK